MSKKKKRLKRGVDYGGWAIKDTDSGNFYPQNYPDFYRTRHVARLLIPYWMKNAKVVRVKFVEVK